jgi:hypothetical protein
MHEGVHSLIDDEVREAATTPQQYTNMTEWGAMQGMFPGGQDQADLASSLYASHPNTTNVVKSDVLVKERVSPEAKRHKLEYDTAYEASPERRKYRADLNRERRRRGMYGDHSGRDISHTEGGKLTVEGAHENRARHFKDQGTLRHVAIEKAIPPEILLGGAGVGMTMAKLARLVAVMQAKEKAKNNERMQDLVGVAPPATPPDMAVDEPHDS